MKKQLQLLLLATAALLAPHLRAQSVETIPLTGLFEPYGIAVDPSDNAYYITDTVPTLEGGTQGRVIKIDNAAGKAEEFADLPDPQESVAQGIVVVTRGEPAVKGLAVADSGTQTIFFIPLSGANAGVPTALGAAGQFASPAGLAAAADGTLYVADLQHNAVKTIAPNAAATTGTLTVNGTTFSHPGAVALADNDATLFVADTQNDVVKKINLSTKTVVDTYTGLNRPRGLVWVGGKTGLLIADTGASVIRVPVFKKGVFNGVGVFAGSENTPGSADGSLSTATFNEPVGITIDGANAILVADLKNNSIRRILRVKAAAPTVDFDTGSYINAVTVDLANRDALSAEGSAANYTLGAKPADPIKSSAPFTTSGVTIDGGPTVLKVRSFNDDLLASDTLAALYSFNVSTPIVTPPGGTFNNDVNVGVSSLTKDSAGNAVVFNFTDDTNKLAKDFTAWDTGDGKNARVIGKSSILRFQGKKTGYEASPIAEANFRFVVANTVLAPPTLSSNNPISMVLSNSTVGAKFYYTENGEDPIFTDAGKRTINANAVSVPNNSTIVINKSETFKIIATKDGYDDSQISSATFVLIVSKPVGAIAGDSLDSDNPIDITLTDDTVGVDYYYSIDGKEAPTAKTGTKINGNKFTVDKSGHLQVVAVKDGFQDSVATTDQVNLKVGIPKIELTLADGVTKPTNSTAINAMTVKLSSSTLAGVTFKYSTDGTSPTNGVSVAAGQVFTITTNALLRVVGIRDNFANSDIAEANIVIKADAPTMNPPGGFFQDGTVLSLTKTRSDSTIHYTTDGSDPTENSPEYKDPLQINHLTFPLGGLNLFKARAFAPNVQPSEISTGGKADKNRIGVSRDMEGGIGSTVFVPIVIGLGPNDPVRSLIYRVQVVPKAPNTKALDVTSLSMLPVSTEDFIPLLGSQTGISTGRVSRATTLVNGVTARELVVSYIGTQANLFLTNFATVNLIAIKLPSNAALNDEYTIQVLGPSATRDAGQDSIELEPAAATSIKVVHNTYRVGDSAPGIWYNAGTVGDGKSFGDGKLDSADVNNAFYASLGIHVPFANSDAFDAMDVFPLDQDGFAGGDGQIRLLDYQTIRDRALGLVTTDWSRGWDMPGVRLPTLLKQSARDTAPLSRQNVGQDSNLPWPPRQALVESSDVPNAQSGKAVQVPVYINVKEGNTLTGLEFRAVIESTGPALTEAAQFTPDVALPVGMSVSGLALNQVAYAWDLDSGLSLQGRVLLGQISFTLPAGALPEQCYRVRFIVADGAKDRSTAADIETIAGCVWVGTDAQPNPFGRLPDEWRKRFFARLDNALANPDGDADGDGVSNWQEYLNGTNPTELRFHRLAEWKDAAKNGFKLRFFTDTDKTYIIESAPSAAGPWTEVGRISGDASIKEFLDQNEIGNAHFYRVRAVDSEN